VGEKLAGTRRERKGGEEKNPPSIAYSKRDHTCAEQPIAKKGGEGGLFLSLLVVVDNTI